MNKGDRLDKLEAIFECSICCELFNEVRVPMMLPCGHSICAFCIASITSPDGSLQCPIDKVRCASADCSKNFAYSEALEATEQLVIKLLEVHLVNPALKKKLVTLKQSFSRRRLQQAKDIVNPPALKPKGESYVAYLSDDIWEDEDFYYFPESSSEEYPQDDLEPVEICWHFRNYRNCRYGDRCKYSHDISFSDSDEPEHVPVYPDKVCYRILRTGTCQFSNMCWYSHDIPENAQEDFRD